MIDLHLHTKHSDGEDTVSEMLKELEKNAVNTIAITDHDTTSAYKELENIDISKVYNGKIVVGMEITTSYKGNRIEILGYGFNNYQLVGEKIDEMNDIDFIPIMKRFRKRILKQFNELGLKYDEIFEDIDGTIDLNRYEVKLYKSIIEKNNNVREKMQEDYCTENESFFRKCIANPKSKFYCNYYQYRPSVIEVIKLIHDNDGLCFFAHPFGYSIENPLSFTEELIRYCIENDAPLDGLETYYYDFDQNQVDQLISLTEKYSLLTSGGSDCHGVNKDKESILGKYLQGDRAIELENLGTWVNELPSFYNGNNQSNIK